MFTTFKVIPPDFKGLNNGKKLAIMSLISHFCQDHFSKKKIIRFYGFKLKAN